MSKEAYVKFELEIVVSSRDEVRMKTLESVPDDGYGGLKELFADDPGWSE